MAISNRRKTAPLSRFSWLERRRKRAVPMPRPDQSDEDLERDPQAPQLTCMFPGCQIETWDAKPFCVEHVFRNEHAARVGAMLEQRDREVSALERHQEVSAHGMLANEVREFLAERPLAASRLAIRLQLEEKLTERLVEQLERAGVLDVKRKRGRKGRKILLASLV